MNPWLKPRGLCLASTATQKGDLSALASSTDTSESCDSGHHDKVPVLTQACRMSNVLCTLFYPGRFIRNLIYALAMLRRCRPQLSLSAVHMYCKGMGILAQSAFWPPLVYHKRMPLYTFIPPRFESTGLPERSSCEVFHSLSISPLL
jgi:hypothetical protein